MPDETGLRGLLMSGRSAFNRPKKGEDTNLPDENPKRKKKFMDRFIDKGSQADKMKSGFDRFMGLGGKKK